MKEVLSHSVSDVVVNVTLVSPNMTSDGSFIQGQDVVFNCTATNPPGVTIPLMFTWVQTATISRPATVLQGDSTEGITVVDEDDYSTLTFTNIQDNTRIEGDYMCRVTNRLSPTDWVTVTVNVDVICELIG